MITSELDGARCTIILGPRFDFSCRSEFRAAYSKAPAGTAYWVDMSQVKYVDSAALGMLLLLRDHAGELSRITITGCHGQPDQVLKIANFHRIFRIE